MSNTKTLRDEFAMAALTGMLSCEHTVGDETDFASDSYDHADAMMKARGAAQPLAFPNDWCPAEDGFRGPDVGTDIHFAPDSKSARLRAFDDFVEFDADVLAAVVSRMGYRVEKL